MRRRMLAAALTLLIPAGLTAARAQTSPTLTCNNADLPSDLSFPAVSSTLPFDATFSSQSSTLDSVQQAFDIFSWASFVALNWPSNPDGTPMDGPITSNPEAPRVWEAYIEGTGVFKPNGAAPDGWGGTNTFLASLIPDYKQGQKVLFATSKNALSEIYQASFGTTTFPWIADLNNNYVFYEIHLNKPEYDYIVCPEPNTACSSSMNLYSQDGQTAFLKSGGTIGFPQGSTSTESCAPRSAPCYSAIEVKASWKEIGPRDDPTTFYTVPATKIDPAKPNNPPVAVQVGLVGLHIITRTSSASQWVWSTFEHVANAPDAPASTGNVSEASDSAVAAPPAGSHFSFNDPTKLQPTVGYGYEPPWPLPSGTLPPESPTPTQITRVVNNVCINGAWTQALNSKMQAELAGTVWANYRLVSTQWPAGSISPVPSGCAFGVFCPGNLTNTTMETYVQNNKFSGSCMNCHNSAQTAGTLPPPPNAKPPGATAPANFSYLLQGAQPTSGGAKVMLRTRKQ
jgi:hypothetical protein